MKFNKKKLPHVSIMKNRWMHFLSASFARYDMSSFYDYHYLFEFSGVMGCKTKLEMWDCPF